MKKLFAGLILAAFGLVPAHAENYYQATVFHRMFGLTFEHAWDRSSLYATGGMFKDTTGLNFDQLGFALGYRFMMNEQAAWQDGWFWGANVAQYQEPDYFKPGVGMELGYQWMGEKSRVTLGGNVGFTTEIFSEEEEVQLSPTFGLVINVGVRGNSSMDYEGQELELPRKQPEL